MALLFITGVLLAQWPAPSGLVAYSFYTDHVGLEWMPAPPIVVSDTLRYDDGHAATGMDLDSGMCAIRFTPAEPCSILSIRFRLHTLLDPRGINLTMYGVNALGLPDLSNMIMPTRYRSVSVGWNDFDAGAEGLAVDEEFFVRFSKGDVLPQMYMMIDSTTTPSDLRSFQYHYMYGWRALPGDLLVRAEVIYLDSGARATLTGTVVKSVYDIEPGFSEEFTRSYHPAPEPRSRPSEATTLIRPDTYSLYRANTYPGAFSMLATVPGSLTTYDDYTVTPGNTYYYTIRADYDSGAYHSGFADTVAGTAYPGISTLVYDTLRHDDGIPSAGVSFPGAVVANKFSTDTRCKLIAIDYHISNPGFGSPKFYWDNRGEPGDEVLGYGDYLLNTTGWARINVAMENIIIDGDFYIGLELDHSLGLSLKASAYGNGWDLPPGEPWVEVPDTTYFIRALIQYADSNAYYHLYSGWNAVSLPVLPHGGLTPSVAFPTAEFVYGWDADSLSYFAPDNLVPGKGYFVYVPNETSYRVSGVPIHRYTLMNAGPGWEFVGGLSAYEGVDTTGITEIPETIIGTRIFYYYNRSHSSGGSGSYEIRRRFMPGEAYWMLFDGEGLFRLSE